MFGFLIFFICVVIVWNVYISSLQTVSKDTIMINHEATEKMARITIKDEYVKNGIKYYIFTTDISGMTKFTMKESEYDEYIGLGNNAVDCTVYTLDIELPIYEYSNYTFFSKLPDEIHGSVRLAKILNNTEHISVGVQATIFSESKAYVKNAYDTEFYTNQYKISVQKIESSWEFLHNNRVINQEIHLKRYSFANETDFSEEEIDNYCKIAENLKADVVKEIQK